MKVTEGHILRRGFTLLPACIVIAIFAWIWLWWALRLPLMGDDMLVMFRYRDFGGDPLSPLRYAWSIWVNTNARTGDMLAPQWLYVLSRPAAAALVGLCVAGTMASMLWLSKSRGLLCSMLVTLFIIVVFPWWDMLHFVCHFNYVWGSALGFAALGVLLNCRLRSLWWLALLPVVACVTATHEALGFPLGVALLVYWFLNHKWLKLTTMQRWWAAAMLAGALFSVSSPASYRRLGGGGEPDLPLHLMLVETLPIVLVLVLHTVYLAVWRREKLRRLLRTRWLIFSVAACVSALFTLAGGIEGRGGWYAECFALMALLWELLRPDCRRVRSRVQVVLAVFILLPMGLTAVINAWNVLSCHIKVFQTLMVRYQSPDTRVRADKELRQLSDEWTCSAMRLLEGKPMVYKDFIYTPVVPYHPGEPNPAAPNVWEQSLIYDLDGEGYERSRERYRCFVR